MKTAEEWAVEMWQPLKERFISGGSFAANMKPFIEAIQQDAFKAGELKGRKVGLEEAREILYKEKRKLEQHSYYNAVKVVEDFIFKIRQHAASLGGGE